MTKKSVIELLKRIGHTIDVFFTHHIILELGVEKEKQQEVDLSKNEWSLKRILMRLILYPFCLFLIGLGVFGILLYRNFAGWVVGFFLIYFGLMFLYIDIKVIVQYHKSRKK